MKTHHLLNDYYLTSDSRQLILFRRKTSENGVTYDTDQTYHPKLSQLVDALLRKHLFSSEAQTLSELLDEQVDFMARLDQRLAALEKELMQS